MTDFIDEMAVFAELKMHWNSEHDRTVIAHYLRQAYERGLEDAALVADRERMETRGGTTAGI